jgi:hypothetical protein
MAKPVTTLNLTFLAAASHGAGVTRSSSTIDATTKYEEQLQIEIQFGGTITADPVVNAYRAVDQVATPTFDTIPVYSFSIARTASTTKRASFTLPTGVWKVDIVNADGSNALTSSSIKAASVDDVAS